MTLFFVVLANIYLKNNRFHFLMKKSFMKVCHNLLKNKRCTEKIKNFGAEVVWMPFWKLTFIFELNCG